MTTRAETAFEPQQTTKPERAFTASCRIQTPVNHAWSRSKGYSRPQRVLFNTGGVSSSFLTVPQPTGRPICNLGASTSNKRTVPLFSGNYRRKLHDDVCFVSSETKSANGDRNDLVRLSK